MLCHYKSYSVFTVMVYISDRLVWRQPTCYSILDPSRTCDWGTLIDKHALPSFTSCILPGATHVTTTFTLGHPLSSFPLFGWSASPSMHMKVLCLYVLWTWCEFSKCSVNFTRLRRGQCQNSYMHTPIEMIFIVKRTKWKKLMEKCPYSFVRC